MATRPASGRLKRVLSLPLVVLYGLGITIGAGIYVLVGETAGRAGMLAPFSFLLAAGTVLLPALSFAELAGRYPYAAGAAQYVEKGVSSRLAGLVIGILMIAAGAVMAGTIALGSMNYLREILPLPPWLLLAAVVIAMGGIAAWGIRESVLFAGILTLVELAGLLAVVIGALLADPALLSGLDRLLPATWDRPALFGILEAGLLAFFAFIGFEDIANVAEEVREPERTIPRAILIILVVSTLLYAAIVAVAVLTVGPAALAAQSAPLAFLFAETTGLPPLFITLIAVAATLNGVIVQIIMISRLSYGLSARRLLPAFLSIVHPRTRTPLLATFLATAVILLLALLFPIVALAEWTSRLILLIFAAVCIALARLKLKGVATPKEAFEAPLAVPLIGAILCAGLLIADMLLA